MQVLNPMIQMTWIKKHWENHYIKKAETMVQEVVCCKLIRQHLLI
jgi:hypothetical protein